MTTQSKARGLLDDVLYLGLAALYYAAPRFLYQIEVEGAQNYRHRPATLIVANHKRDLDSVILPATLFYNGVRPKRPLWFAGREDMFWRGFLASFEVVPAWLRRVLYEIDLTAVMRALRVLPVRRFPERTMEEALREIRQVWGDPLVAEVLTAEEAGRWVDRCGPQARVSDLLAWRYWYHWRRPAALRTFAPGVHDHIRALQRQAVDRQIRILAAVLDRGGVLYLAPEGVISPDGRLQAFRSGLRQILQAVRVEVRIVPACIVYDFMAAGPLRVLITVGEETVVTGSPVEAEHQIRRRLAALHTMTTTQVASVVLWELARSGRTSVDLSEFTTQVREVAAEMQASGLRVDASLFSEATPRVAGWVRYAAQHRVLRRQERDLHVDPARLVLLPVTHWENPVRYCVNEVWSVRAASDLRAGVAREAETGG